MKSFRLLCNKPLSWLAPVSLMLVWGRAACVVSARPRGSAQMWRDPLKVQLVHAAALLPLAAALPGRSLDVQFISWESCQFLASCPSARYIPNKPGDCCVPAHKTDGNSGPVSGFWRPGESSGTGSGACWPRNTLRLRRTRSCLLASASAGGPWRRSFAWIFSGLMRLRGRRTAGKKNNMISGDKIMTRRCKLAKVCQTLLCKPAGVWLRAAEGERRDRRRLEICEETFIKGTVHTKVLFLQLGDSKIPKAPFFEERKELGAPVAAGCSWRVW